MRMLALLLLLFSACDDGIAIADNADLSAADLAPLGKGALCFTGLAGLGKCAAGLKCCIPHCPYANPSGNPDGGNDQLCWDPLAYCEPSSGTDPPPGFDHCFDSH